MKINLKTPIVYYGGKVSMLNYLLPLIPEHKVYCEPFFGGGAVFWAKEKAKIECINDINGLVVNFYEVLKNDFPELKEKVESTIYGRDTHKHAQVVCGQPHLFDRTVRAWAFWVLTNWGFNGDMKGGWRGSSLLGKNEKKIIGQKRNFTAEISERLEGVAIENKNAVELLAHLDSEETFYFIDPPYVGANQGHYSGYTQTDFNLLLNALSNLKGKFLLTTYPNSELDRFVENLSWHKKELLLSNSASPTSKKKIEVLTTNYKI